MGGVETLILVGRIVRPHGIHGEVKVVSLTEWSEDFEKFCSLYVEDESGKGKWMKIKRRRVRDNQIILKLEEINNRDEAKLVRGFLLKAKREKFPALPEDSYYVFDLIGLCVRTTKGEKIGSLSNVLQMPAQDIYVVDTKGREVLIPAVKDFIKQIDIKGGEIVIEPIDGLLD